MNRGTLKPILVITAAALAVALSLADSPRALAGGVSGGPGVLGRGGAGMVPKNAAVVSAEGAIKQSLTRVEKARLGAEIARLGYEGARYEEREQYLLAGQVVVGLLAAVSSVAVAPAAAAVGAPVYAATALHVAETLLTMKQVLKMSIALHELAEKSGLVK